MTDAAFGHNGNADAGFDFFNHFRVAHTRYAALGANIGRYAFQRHDGDGAGIFGDFGLFGIGNVHDDAVLQHLGQTELDLPILRFCCLVHV